MQKQILSAAFNSRLAGWVVAVLLLVAQPGTAASLFEKLGLKSKTGTNAASGLGLSALSEEQVIQGLKEALAKGATQAVGSLGRQDGFYTNLNVRIPMPESLVKVEKTLRAVGQSQLADSFVQTMNRAAEQAVPEAAGILGNSIKQMTLADAKGILTGPTNAATLYFRRTSETNLFEKFLPIVQKTTAQAGVTSAYKQMIDKAGAGGSFLSGFIKTQAPDLDSYVTQKALDGLFKMVAEEEARIRQNPAARTTEILQKVFGATLK